MPFTANSTDLMVAYEYGKTCYTLPQIATYLGVYIPASYVYEQEPYHRDKYENLLIDRDKYEELEDRLKREGLIPKETAESNRLYKKIDEIEIVEVGKMLSKGSVDTSDSKEETNVYPYTAKYIAEELGIYSSNDKPHSHLIMAIALESGAYVPSSVVFRGDTNSSGKYSAVTGSAKNIFFSFAGLLKIEEWVKENLSDYAFYGDADNKNSLRGYELNGVKYYTKETHADSAV